MSTTDNPHPAALDPQRLLADCDVQRTRASGPGGQHRNKVETAVVVTHRLSGVQGAGSERRSQEQNRKAALFRLRVNLALTVRQDVAEDTPPSDLWRSRCRGGRVEVNPGHDDFPALLAEALDMIAAHSYDVRAAAETLGCSASQLIKLCKPEPRALHAVNEERQRRGLRRLT